jgi:CHAT domain-containing protein/tetratricopeptide (TPR) repeat protein
MEAIAHFEVSLSHWRAAQDHVEAARTLMTIGMFYAQSGDRQRAMEYTTQGLSVAEASHDRRMEAWALENLATVWNNFADMRKAIEYADQALPMMREVGDRSGEADALNNLGRAYALTGEPRKGIDYFEGAMRVYREIQIRESMAAVAGNLGVIHNRLGENQLALEYHQQSLALNRETGNQGGEAITLSNIGSCYQDLGEFQKALDSYSAALDINRRLDRRHNMGSNFHNIASAYDSLGDRQHALQFYQQALEIFRVSDDQWSIGNTTNNIGTVYGELRDYPSAIKFFNEALTFRRAVGNRGGEAVTLNNIGKTYLLLGNRDEALDHFERALAIHREAGQKLSLTATLRNLGTFYQESGTYERASSYLEEALETSRTIRDRQGEASTLAVLASLERDRGDSKKAYEMAEAALAAFESVRASVFSPTLRASFFTSAREAQEIDIDALIRLHNEGAALLASEKSRARSLLEMLGESGVEIRRDADAAVVGREHELQQLIAAKADRQVRLLAGEHTEGDASSVAAELDALTTELEQVQSRIRDTSPAYAALTQPSPLDLREIQTKVLDQGTVLLEYALGSRKSVLWVVTPSSTNLFELPAKAEIESAAKRVYDLLTARNRKLEKESSASRAARVRQADEAFGAAAAKASAMLLGPAAAHIAHKRLLIVAEGVLQYLPFSALPEPGSIGSPVPLIANHEIVSAPSASVLAILREETAGRSPAEKGVAILADPVFNANDARIGRQQKTPEVISAPDAHRSAADVGVQEFVRLRFSRTEAEEIARLAPAGSTLKALDFDASRDTVLNPEFGQYRILHFATHSLLNNEHPELSGVVLSLVDRAGRPQNGFLRLYDIYNLRLVSDLVVLSACQTALGEDVTGEGLIGLTRGFLYAGAPRVVATLWEIDDRTTAELMRRFYEAMLKRGERPASALRAAQIAMWKAKGWDAPYYWAAFTLQGEWR